MEETTASKAVASVRHGHFVAFVLRNNKSLYAQFNNGTHYLGRVDNETINYVRALSSASHVQIKEEQR